MKKTALFKAMAFCMVVALSLAVFPVGTANAEAEDGRYNGCMIQHENRWLQYSFNGGTLPATGCGIFALVNCVGYLTGETMDVVEVATWAHAVGGFNVYGPDGTYRTELYPLVEAKYGKKYNITVDCDYDGGGYWEGASSTRLKNHLKNGGTAIAHVPGHFIAIVGYDEETKKYHVYDSSPSPKRGTNKNNGDLWVRETELSLNVFKMDWFCLISSTDTKKDTKAPVISDVTFSDVTDKGYTINCTVIDDVFVTDVAFPTWTEANGQDDIAKNYMVTETGTRTGDKFSFTVTASKHKNEKEGYITHIYAKDHSGNVAKLELGKVNIEKDKKGPEITDVVISDRTLDGYTISCKVTDNWGVSKVAFPAWTVENGQDDLAANFLETQLGEKNGDVYTFRVDTANHGNEQGDYITHIYGFDFSGNKTVLELGMIAVKDPAFNILLKMPSAFEVTDKFILTRNKMTISQMLEQFENDNLTVKNKNGEALTGDESVGSGYTVSIEKDGSIKDIMTTVVCGDLDCNGAIDEEDRKIIISAILETATLGEIENVAADMDGNNSIDVSDYMNLKKATLGL